MVIPLQLTPAMDFQPQHMYPVYPVHLQLQPQFVEDTPYISDMAQGHPCLQYVDSFYEVNAVHSAAPVASQPAPQMLQPSPVVHAPIPILHLGAQFTEAQCSFPVDDQSAYFPAPDYANMPRPEIQVPQIWNSSSETTAQPFLAPTFPTPSELLIELAGDDATATDIGQQVPIGAPSPVPETGSASPGPSDGSFYTDVPERTKARPKSRVSSRSTSIIPDGAPPTNDTISSHEKKRHYLECLEQYVMYLHTQYNLLGVTPVPLRRVDSYRGLNSRSIRTLLVHMENNNNKLNSKTVAEERRFMALRDEVLRKESLSQNPQRN